MRARRVSLHQISDMEDVKTQIITTASRLFLQYGLRSVTIDDVCNEVHISKKTFYNYFRQKEDLIDTVLFQFLDLANDKKNKNKSIFDDSSLNTIDKIVLAFKHWKQDSSIQHSMTLMYDLVKYYPKISTKITERQEQKSKESFKKWIQQGVEEGLIRSDVSIDLLTTYMYFQFSKALSELIGKLEVSLSSTMEFLQDSNIRVLVSEKGYRYYQEKYKKEYPQLNTTSSGGASLPTGGAFYWSEPPLSEEE